MFLIPSIPAFPLLSFLNSLLLPTLSTCPSQSIPLSLQFPLRIINVKNHADREIFIFKDDIVEIAKQSAALEIHSKADKWGTEKEKKRVTNSKKRGKVFFLSSEKSASIKIKSRVKHQQGMPHNT
jgi:hypothetical protein